VKEKNKFAIAATILILSLFMTGCEKKVEADLLGDEACRPPCWMNIIPGATKRREAIEILTSLESGNKGQLTILDSGIISWHSQGKKNYFLYSTDNTITMIKLDLRPSSTNLSDIQLIFGTPTNIRLEHVGGGYFSVSIFYPDKGLDFILTGNDRKYTLEPNMKIIFAYFLGTTDLRSMLGTLYGAERLTEVLNTIQEWKGYQNIRP
jgi:hypothetical protein